MPKFEIIVNEIHEDGTRTPLTDEGGTPFSTECLGFCLMAKTAEVEDSISSQIGAHMISGQDLYLMIRDCKELREVARHVAAVSALDHLMTKLEGSNDE